MPITQFWDMHSGGGRKLDWEKIYIEAPEQEARIIFYNRFGRSPDRVTCTCCGSDYSVTEYPDIAQASAYHRNCAYDKKIGAYVEKQDENGYRPYLTVDEYLEKGDREGKPLFIRAEEIDPEERVGSVPEEGYIWR